MGTENDWYALGKEAQRRGEFGEAINCYAEAEKQNPDGPAATAKQMLEEIMAFYHKDAYNP